MLIKGSTIRPRNNPAETKSDIKLKNQTKKQVKVSKPNKQKNQKDHEHKMLFRNLTRQQYKKFKILGKLLHDKYETVDNQRFFSESEATKTSFIRGKCWLKNSYFRKPVRLYNWNQPIKHIKNVTLTLIWHAKWLITTKNIDE